MNGTKSLGRGLDALFGGAQAAAKAMPAAETMAIDQLRPNAKQPRHNFDEHALRELADSITVQGILQPLLVRPRENGVWFEIVAGERRWRAAQLAGLKNVPVYVRDLSDDEVLAAALIENLQREDLDPIEEAEALQALQEAMQLTQGELAERLGKSRPAVTNALRLLQLSENARLDVRAGRLSAGHARCLLGIEDQNAMELLREYVLQNNSTVRETEALAAQWRESGKFPWTDGAQAITRRAVRKKSPAVKQLQATLRETVGCRATVCGSEDAGRIAFAYDSREELQHLLERLGVKTGSA